MSDNVIQDPNAFVASPAAYSKELLPYLKAAIEMAQQRNVTLFSSIYDPMAGNGNRLAELATMISTPAICPIVLAGSEIEPEFIAQPWIVRRSMFDYVFRHDIVVCSPAYGNRMSDQYLGTPAEQALRAETGKKPRRTSYAISIGRKLTKGSGAGLQWGPAYRDFHRAAWQHVYEKNVDPGGHFILNTKSHYRNHGLCDVAGWHLDICQQIGFKLVEWWEVECPGMRDGANADLRELNEHVYLFQKELQPCAANEPSTSVD